MNFKIIYYSTTLIVIYDIFKIVLKSSELLPWQQAFEIKIVSKSLRKRDAQCFLEILSLCHVK